MSGIQERIIQTVLELNREKYVDDITVCEVTQKAKVSRTSFYTYFNDVYSVIETIEDSLIAEFNNLTKDLKQYHLDKHHVDNPSYIDISILEFIYDNKDKFRILLGKYGDPLFRYKYAKFLEEVGVEKYYNDYNIVENKNFVSAFLVNGLISVVEEWLFRKPEISPKAMERITTKLLHGYFLASKL